MHMLDSWRISRDRTVIRRLEANNIKTVNLMPFMLVAGDHAINDMAGDEEDSWKSIFESHGFEVKNYTYKD